MISTIGDLIAFLQKFDPNLRVNIVDGHEYTDQNGHQVTSFGTHSVEAVLELKNGCVGIITPDGFRIGKDLRD